MTFSETDLRSEIISAVADLGYTEPTPIQEKAIPVILGNDHDLVALAQTGTGKTAAFGLPVISQLDMEANTIQSLMLAPTRELCVQIAKDLEGFGKYMKGLSITAVYGGASMEGQIRQLKRKPQIVVGTPGRTLDLIRRGVLKVDAIRWLVLDEADEMLKMGFQDDMDAILAATPETRQTLLFSATMPREIVGMTKRYMKSPEEISVGTKNTGSDNVEHWFYVANHRDRYLVLKRIADLHPDIYGIVFCKTRIETQEIATMLMGDGYSADALHGDMSQSQRDHVMGRFRAGNLQLLIATDVAARGLDVNELTHVINFRLPDQLDSYIHRSGRTGRAGNSGISISIVGPRDRRSINILERQVGKEFIMKKIPTGGEILQHQLLSYVNRLQAVEVDAEKVVPYLDPIYEQLADLSREELIQKFVSMEFDRLISYYESARDINSLGGGGRDRDRGNDRRNDDRGDRRDNDRGDRGGDRRDRGDRGDRRSERSGASSFSRFFINLGNKNYLNPPKLINLINSRSELRNVSIGKIEILKKFSFFEVDSKYAAEAVSAFSGVEFDGISIHVEPAEASGPSSGMGKERNVSYAQKRRKPAEDSGAGFWTKAPTTGSGRSSSRSGKPFKKTSRRFTN